MRKLVALLIAVAVYLTATPGCGAQSETWWTSGFDAARQAQATTMVRGDAAFKVYRHMWFHNDKWYALRDRKTANGSLEEGLTANNDLVVFPVADVPTLLSQVEIAWVPGVTLMLDFPFASFAEHLGHWIELLAPLFSVLHDARWIDATADGRSKYIDTILIMNIHKYMNDWVQETLSMALQPALRRGIKLPIIIDRNDLFANKQMRWLGFENMLVITDRYTHPNRLRGYPAAEHGDAWKHEGCQRFVSSTWKCGFIDTKHGHVFRAHAYKTFNKTLPKQAKPPRQITWLMAHHGDVIHNKVEVQAMLQEVADEVGWKFRPVTVTPSAPFDSHLDIMVDTGLLVGRTTTTMANALFLPPGAAVFEFLPFNWEWQGLSQLYYNTTQSMGDIHHFAWRPFDARWALYSEAHEARYGLWTTDECSSKECVAVHERASLIVDVETVKPMLVQLLKKLASGATSESLRQPWPKSASS